MIKKLTLITFLLGISACIPINSKAPTNNNNNGTATSPRILISTPTHTPSISLYSPTPQINETPTPSTTKSSTQSIKISGTKPSTHTTITSQPNQQFSSCKPSSTEPAPSIDFIYQFGEDTPPIEDIQAEMVQYLNTYGPTAFVYKAIEKGKFDQMRYQDLTNDGLPEISLRLYRGYGSYYSIFGYHNGSYQLLYGQTDIDTFFSPYQIITVRDGNKNNLPEITILPGYMSQGGHSYFMIEWDGNRFKYLLLSSPNEYFANKDNLEASVNVEASGKVYYQDMDGDGIDEFVVSTGIPIWVIYEDGLPFQNVIRYHKWDGNHYSFWKQVYGPPEYRFQAVQNGDRLSKIGDYTNAISMYEQAIFSDQLKWWSEELHITLQNNLHNPEPTPIPIETDPLEYPNLAAYARYRIMIVYIKQGYLSAAKTVYETLINKFPKGHIGHAYAEMAAEFWNAYQQSFDINIACKQAINYATQHPNEILTYLGKNEYSTTFFGSQSLEYTPESICPFP